MTKIKIELKDNPKGYSFAIGILDKDLDKQKILVYESDNKKKMIKWLNKTIVRKCKKMKETNLWFCFNYREKTDVYTIEEIQKSLNKEGIFII